MKAAGEHWSKAWDSSMLQLCARCTPGQLVSSYSAAVPSRNTVSEPPVPSAHPSIPCLPPLPLPPARSPGCPPPEVDLDTEFDR